MNTICTKCGIKPTGLPWYHVAYNAERYFFCSRVCLVEFMAPEVKKAIVVGQWIDPPIPVEVKRFIPTPEEEERMCQ